MVESTISQLTWARSIIPTKMGSEESSQISQQRSWQRIHVQDMFSFQEKRAHASSTSYLPMSRKCVESVSITLWYQKTHLGRYCCGTNHTHTLSFHASVYEFEEHASAGQVN